MVGVVIGVIDLIPMIFNGLPADANLSAFSLWVIASIFASKCKIVENPILNGVIISFMVLLPAAILIAWREPFSLIPITLMTLLLGSLMGYAVNRIK